jgi:uncharacterized membrane protein YGL010W
MLGGKSWEEWIAQYGRSHQHPINRFCHTLGIPLILLSIPLFVAALWLDELWLVALLLFVAGWIFQFVGHAVEGNPPSSCTTGAFCLWA